MKRIAAFFLAVLMVGTLFGCGKQKQDTVQFFYLQRSFAFEGDASVLAAEEREISGRREDLRFLLGLYLAGPSDEAYVSPFPRNTRLIQVSHQDSTLILELSKEFDTLRDMDLTLAAACLASTCFHLSQADTVQILAEGPSHNTDITLTRESLTLYDNSFVDMEPVSATGQ